MARPSCASDASDLSQSTVLHSEDNLVHAFKSEVVHLTALSTHVPEILHQLCMLINRQSILEPPMLEEARKDTAGHHCKGLSVLHCKLYYAVGRLRSQNLDDVIEYNYSAALQSCACICHSNAFWNAKVLHARELASTGGSSSKTMH